MCLYKRFNSYRFLCFENASLVVVGDRYLSGGLRGSGDWEKSAISEVSKISGGVGGGGNSSKLPK